MTTRKLRILQVMRAPVGGLFRHVADLTRALSANGHEVGLVVDSLANDAQTEGKLDDLRSSAALGIHRFPMPRVLGSGDLTTPFAVRRLAQSLDVDVLHGHGAKGGFYARLARLGNGKAVALYTPHGGVLHFSNSSLSGRAFHTLERWLMAQTAAIIFESAYARKTYSNLIGTPSCADTVIHNGIAPDEFTPVPPNADAADFVFVGELRDLKGIFILIEALAEVRRPDGKPAKLIMAGDGPDRDALVDQISQLGMGERVQLLGAQPARPTFAKGRIAVIPSLAESLPYIVLEAAAAGLPVISTHVGGIPEIFATSAQALVPPRDVGALRMALQKALDQPDSLAEITASRLSYIADHFALAKMTDAIETLYHAALDKA